MKAVFLGKRPRTRFASFRYCTKQLARALPFCRTCGIATDRVCAGCGTSLVTGLCVAVGRILQAPTRPNPVFRFQAEYPQSLTGQQFLVRIYRHEVYYVGSHERSRPLLPQMKRGDLVAVAFLKNKGVRTGVFYNNLTITIADSLFPDDSKRRWFGFGPLELKTPPVVVAAKADVEYVVAQMRRLQGHRLGLEPDRQAEAGAFESLVAALFEREGYSDVSIVGGAGDMGVDITANSPIGKIVIQCKHQSLKSPIKPTQVRDFAHVIEREKTNGVVRGLFVTSSTFSPECYLTENKGNTMELIDRSTLEKRLNKVGMSFSFMREKIGSLEGQKESGDEGISEATKKNAKQSNLRDVYDDFVRNP